MPAIPTQSSSNPVRAAKRVSHLQQRRHHDASWSVAETLPRTSAPERNYSCKQRLLQRTPAGPHFRGAGAGLRRPSPAGHASRPRPRLLAWFYPVASARLAHLSDRFSVLEPGPSAGRGALSEELVVGGGSIQLSCPQRTRLGRGPGCGEEGLEERTRARPSIAASPWRLRTRGKADRSLQTGSGVALRVRHGASSGRRR